MMLLPYSYNGLDKYSTDVYSVQEEKSGPDDERGRHKIFSILSFKPLICK